MSESIAERLAHLPAVRRRALLGDVDERDADSLMADWRFWARPEQIIPDGEWHGWLICAGRGWGKNRAGAEGIIEEIRANRAAHVGLIARTAKDVRDIIVEGPSGVLTVAPRGWRPVYEPGKTRLVFPNGAVAKTYSAEEPDSLRGPEHDLIWGDEVSTWQYRSAWDNAMLGLRVGRSRWIATMTPKGVPLVRELLREASSAGIVLVGGTTYENYANLSVPFRQYIVRKYAGTRLAKQELEGVLLDDNPDALWSRDVIERNRVVVCPPLSRLVVAVDPQGSTESEASETGIVAAGIASSGDVYVLADRTLSAKPPKWAGEAIALLAVLQGDRIVAEVNHGGDMVVSTIHAVNSAVFVEKVRASRGKYVRAEPVAALYEQNRVKHVGTFGPLEDELCTWMPGDARSPNRMDALVWAVTALGATGDDPKYGRDFGVG